MDPDEAIGALAADFALHPLPIVVESLRFNFRYVLDHGYRAFYQMTADYLGGLAKCFPGVHAAWSSSSPTGCLSSANGLPICDSTWAAGIVRAHR